MRLGRSGILLSIVPFLTSNDLCLSTHPSLHESWIEKQYLIC